MMFALAGDAGVWCVGITCAPKGFSLAWRGMPLRDVRPMCQMISRALFARVPRVRVRAYAFVPVPDTVRGLV